MTILNDFDKRTCAFLFVFLNIILYGAVFLIIYGVYYKFISEYTPLLIYQNIKITLEYLSISLCECIGGALLIDYILRKENQSS